jgi:hypothetical protein
MRISVSEHQFEGEWDETVCNDKTFNTIHNVSNIFFDFLSKIKYSYYLCYK